MNTNYCEKYFVNPAIEHGISGYIHEKNGEHFPRAHIFEVSVIKALTIIYGEKSILLPYKIDNERAFECNLMIYDLKETDAKNFIKLMNSYYEFILNYRTASGATGIIYEIEKILIEMINKRNKKKEFNNLELNEFDKIFNPSDGDLLHIKKLLSSDDGLIIKTWKNSKFDLTNTQMKLMAVNPNLLLPERYARFGFDIRTVASMNSYEIENINKKIEQEENREKISFKNMKQRNKIVFSCGNGFVDKLLLLGVAATEIMIFLIIFSVK